MKSIHSHSRHNPQQRLRRAKLTAAIRDTLQSAIASYPQFDALMLLDIDDANPANLIVIMGAEVASEAELYQHEASIQLLSGSLRAAAASTVRRKRIPHLRFRVVPMDFREPNDD